MSKKQISASSKIMASLSLALIVASTIPIERYQHNDIIAIKESTITKIKNENIKVQKEKE